MNLRADHLRLGLVITRCYPQAIKGAAKVLSIEHFKAGSGWVTLRADGAVEHLKDQRPGYLRVRTELETLYPREDEMVEVESSG